MFYSPDLSQDAKKGKVLVHLLREEFAAEAVRLCF